MVWFEAAFCAAMLSVASLASAEPTQPLGDGEREPLSEPEASTAASVAGEPVPSPLAAPAAIASSVEQQELYSALRETLADLNIKDPEIRVLAPGSDLKSVLGQLKGIARWQWVAALLTDSSGSTELAIFGVAPHSKVVTGRIEKLGVNNLEIRVIHAVRDIVLVPSAEATTKPEQACAADGTAAPKTRSLGRSALTFNTALVGAYIGFAVQRAGGSDDARLSYPLVALGTGVGIGAAMVIADEWDISVGDAWFLSAGAIWPTTSALLLADSYGVRPEESRFLAGLAGTFGGLTLATFALSQTEHMSEGQATLTHSGGALGLLLGGVGEMMWLGETKPWPFRGMGYGTLIAVLAAGTVTSLGFDPAPSQVLSADLGAGLGGLVGAAVASPLALGDSTRAEHRLWLTSIAFGAVAGGAIGYLVTDQSPLRGAELPFVPYASVLPGNTVHDPAGVTLGLTGVW